jgi:integrase
MKRRQEGSVVFDKRRDVWNFLYRDGGVRRTRTLGHVHEIPTRAAAWALVGQLNHEQIRSVPKHGRTVKEVAELYDSERLSQLRPETRRVSLSHLRCHVLPKWGSIDLRSLKPRDVELWLRSLELSPKSCAHIRNLMHALVEHAQWSGLQEPGRNVIELVKVKGSTKRVRKPRSLTTSEFQALIRELKEPVRTLSIICACLGLRVSEGLGLRWSDIDWLSSTVAIERACVRQRVDECKTEGSRRNLTVAAELMAALQLWKQSSQFSEPESFVFASPVKLGKQPISYTEIRRELRRASAAAKIGHLSTHSFRHSFRTWLDSLGVPVGVQQRAMRHASVTTTMNTYGDALPDDLRRVHQQVSELALRASDCEK